MRLLRGLFALGLIWLCAAAPAWGQNDHLLITEFVVTPTPGEYIEIYNPTPAAIDLSQYYLTDDIFNNDNDYVNVVYGSADSLSVVASDFVVKFPAGASIAPKGVITVALSGSGFQTTYARAADYEILSTDPNVMDMTGIEVGSSAGLTDGSETIVLFSWDGTSDLVQDVDYVVWGNKGTATDKTGLAIDGPDAGTETSTYKNDTPVASQTVVNADNDGDLNPHNGGASAARNAFEAGETLSGGNGVAGHDETSENLSFAGGS